MTKIVHGQIVRLPDGPLKDDDFVFRVGWDIMSAPCGDKLMRPVGGVQRFDCFFVACRGNEEAFAKALEYEPRAIGLRYTTFATVAVLREAIGA